MQRAGSISEKTQQRRGKSFATAAAGIIEHKDAVIERLQHRLDRIAKIIEAVDDRCAAADGPVTPTLKEMTQQEISAIYALAMGHRETWRPPAN